MGDVKTDNVFVIQVSKVLIVNSNFVKIIVMEMGFVIKPVDHVCVMKDSMEILVKMLIALMIVAIMEFAKLEFVTVIKDLKDQIVHFKLVLTFAMEMENVLKDFANAKIISKEPIALNRFV